MEHTLALIEKAHEGDKAARDTLAEENMGLVWSMVRRFANRGVEMEDLCQIGSIGLLKAIDKFDPSFEVCFSTYAVPMIAGEIRRFLRSEGENHDISLMDRIPEKENGQEKLLNRIFLEELLGRLPAKERQLIYMRYFQDMTQAQIAGKLGISQVQVSRMEKKILRQMRMENS